MGLMAALFGLFACEVSTPYRRTVLAPESAEVVVGLTSATLDRGKRGGFDRYTRQVVDAIEDSPGLLGFSVRRELLGDKVWTMSVWSSEAHLDAFVRSPMHQAAIRNGMPAVLRAQFHRVRRAANLPPLTWAEVKAMLESAPVRTYGRE